VEWSDKNYKFVFWHEASYVPFWELSDGTGLSYQFFEGAGEGGELFNPYGRKEANSFVTVEDNGLQSNRVKVRWDYYDVNKDTGLRVGHGVEYFYFYHNGLGVREASYTPCCGDPRNSVEPFEMMALNPVRGSSHGNYWWDNFTYSHCANTSEPLSKEQCPNDREIFRTYRLMDVYSGDVHTGYAQRPCDTDDPNWLPDSSKRGQYGCDINETHGWHEGLSKPNLKALNGVAARAYLKDLDPFAIYGVKSGFTNVESIEDVGREWGYPHFIHWHNHHSNYRHPCQS